MRTWFILNEFSLVNEALEQNNFPFEMIVGWAD